MNWVDIPQLNPKQRFRNPELNIVNRHLRLDHIYRKVGEDQYRYRPCKCGHYRFEHELCNSKGNILQRMWCLLSIGHGYCEKKCDCKHYKKIELERWLNIADKYIDNVHYRVARFPIDNEEIEDLRLNT